MAYDIFISYRRRGAGAGVAGEMQAKFENQGYKVFLDVDEIGSGQFPEQIEKAIAECKDFLLVLSPGTLDRCVEEEDWVRREIVQAQSQNKNIIGVGLPGFVMPETMPDPLQSLPTIQVFSWTHEYRNASFAKIEENLVSSMLRKKRKRLKLLALSAFAIVAFVSLFLLMPKKPAPEPAVTEMPKEVVPVEYQMFDLHAKKAADLTKNLPDIAEFREHFVQLVSNKEPFVKLMDGIAECDSAIMLKKQYSNMIVDSYDIENQRAELNRLRKGYLDVIFDDVKVLLDADGAMFATQDMEVAGILALSDDKSLLDSLDAVIKKSLNK